MFSIQTSVNFNTAEVRDDISGLKCFRTASFSSVVGLDFLVERSTPRARPGTAINHGNNPTRGYYVRNRGPLIKSAIKMANNVVALEGTQSEKRICAYTWTAD